MPDACCVVPRIRFAAFALLLIGVGCGGVPESPRSVVYWLSDDPLSGAHAGTCLDSGRARPNELEALEWAPGARVRLSFDWEIPGCGFWFHDEQKCRANQPQVALREIDGDSWKLIGGSAGVPPSEGAILEALKPGVGGLSVHANGADFPSISLHTSAFTHIRVERASGTSSRDVVPGEISELHLGPNETSIVAVTLFHDSTHICGLVPMLITASGSATASPALSGDPSQPDMPYANSPIAVHSGESLGAGTVTFAAGEQTAVLQVVVEP